MPHDAQNCKQIFELLSEYLSLELPPESCEQIEQHLAGCPPCLQFLESLRQTVALCRDYQPPLMPEPLTAEARAELEMAWRKLIAAKST